MAEGDIDAVLDSLTFDTGFCDTPDLIHISGDIYAIAYTGPDNDGWLCTCSIDVDGNIGASVIDTLEFDALTGYFPSIIHVSGNVYAIAYSGDGSDGWVCTFTIDPAGNISAGLIDTLEFDDSLATDVSIIHISGDIFAVAYRGPGSDGWLCTLTINAAGNIGATVIDTLQWDATNGYEPSIIHVSGEIYAIAYRGDDSDGYLITLSIDGSGNIGGAVIDSLEFDGVMCYVPNIVNIFVNIFAVAYYGPGSAGTLKTFTIDGSGNIGASAIDTFTFDAVIANWPHLQHVSGNVYAISYTGDGSDGFICTLAIETDGTIIAAIIDSLEFDPDKCDQPGLLFCSGSVYAIAYQNIDDYGVLKTVGVETRLPGGPKLLPLMGIG